MSNANWFDADLKDAFLLDAHLSGANLTYADLRGADVWMAIFDENTIPPDMRKWTPDTDITRFTDAKHPDFWHL